MGDDLIQAVLETIDIAKTQRMQLANRLDSLEEAKKQIESSAQTSREKLQKHFDHLKSCINKALDDRLKELVSQVDEIENSAIEPLQECEEVIVKGSAEAMQVLKDGKKILMGDHEKSEDIMNAFNNRPNELGLNKVPEVPSLAEVPCVYIDLPRDTCMAEAQLMEAIRDYGRVIPKAPVQIAEVQEQPGSLRIKWCIMEDEHSLDLDEFLLEYSAGSVRSYDDIPNNTFKAAYQGPATSHVVRHLVAAKSYTFRVCGRVEGAPTWSPWSIPFTALTSVPHHQWKEDSTKDYSVGIENKTAEKITDKDSLLYSRTSSYTCGHTVVFKIHETGEMCSSDGIALLAKNKGNESDLLGPSSIFVAAEGRVYMNGQEKTTRLPSLSRGSVLTLDTEVLQKDKVRITIDIDERNVIFDWVLDNEGSESQAALMGFMSEPSQNQVSMYFAAKFTKPNWKIGVE